MNRLENGLAIVEAAAWLVSMAPVINTPAGGIKALIGTIQLISGLAVAIFASPFACFSEKGRSLAKQGLKHIVHGFGNIISGILLSIPIIGNIIAIKRGCVEGSNGVYWHYHSHNLSNSDIIYKRG